MKKTSLFSIRGRHLGFDFKRNSIRRGHILAQLKLSVVGRSIIGTRPRDSTMERRVAGVQANFPKTPKMWGSWTLGLFGLFCGYFT